MLPGSCGTPNRSSLTGDRTPDHASSCNSKSDVFKTKEQQERKQCTHLQDLNNSWSSANSHRDVSGWFGGQFSGLYEFYPRKFPTQPRWVSFYCFLFLLENICKLYL